MVTRTRPTPADDPSHRRSVGGSGHERSADTGRQRTAAIGRSRRFDHRRGRIRTLTALVAPRPGAPEARVPLVVRLRSVVCLLGRFPALAGVDLDVARRGDRAARGAERRRQDDAAPPHRRAWSRCTPARPRSSARPHRRPARRPPQPRARRSRDVLLRRPDRARRTCGSSPRRPAASGDDADADDRAARPRRGRRPHPPEALGRPAPPARARRSRSSATRSCCCSTSPTPVSTPTGATCSHEIVAAAPGEGRTVVMASHELDLARPSPPARSAVDSRPVAGSRRRPERRSRAPS